MHADCTHALQTQDLKPTFFFDLENVRHLPPDLYVRYISVLEVLASDRLGEHFDGSLQQMNKLCLYITVFDMFVVGEAFRQHPSMLAETDISRAPSSYDEWKLRCTHAPSVTAMVPLDHDAQSTSAENDDTTVGVTVHGVLPTIDRARRRRGGRRRSVASRLLRREVSGEHMAECDHSSPCASVVRTTTLPKRRKFLSRDLDRISIRFNSRKSWRKGFDVLSQFYKPETLVYIDCDYSPGLPIVEECLHWAELPSIVYTFDSAFYHKWPSEKRLLSVGIGWDEQH